MNENTNDLHTCPITSFLVKLGKVLLKANPQSEWLDMETLTGLCKDNHILLEGHIPTARELESALKPFLKQLDELYADGVNVMWNDCRVRWDLVFSVRFYRYNPAQWPYRINLSTVDLTVKPNSLAA